MDFYEIMFFISERGCPTCPSCAILAPLFLGLILISGSGFMRKSPTQTHWFSLGTPASSHTKWPPPPPFPCKSAKSIKKLEISQAILAFTIQVKDLIILFINKMKPVLLAEFNHQFYSSASLIAVLLCRYWCEGIRMLFHNLVSLWFNYEIF